MQFCQYTRLIPRRKLNRPEFATPVGPHAEIELVRIVVAADYRSGALVIGGDVVGVGDGERGGVEGDYRDAGDA